MKFGVLGSGKTGISIAYHLWQSGSEPLFLWKRFLKRIEKASQYVPFDKCTTKLDAYPGNCDFIMVSACDGVLENMINYFVTLNKINGKKIFHLSGAMSSKVL